MRTYKNTESISKYTCTVAILSHVNRRVDTAHAKTTYRFICPTLSCKVQVSISINVILKFIKIRQIVMIISIEFHEPKKSKLLYAFHFCRVYNSYSSFQLGFFS